MTEEEALEVADLGGGTILVSRVVAEGPENGSAFQVLLATDFAPLFGVSLGGVGS